MQSDLCATDPLLTRPLDHSLFHKSLFPLTRLVVGLVELGARRAMRLPASRRFKCNRPAGLRNLLVLHDTCEFTCYRNKESDIGVIEFTASGKNKAGRPICNTIRGVLMHSSLVITPEGVPLGLAAVKFWSRKKFKRCDSRRILTMRESRIFTVAESSMCRSPSDSKLRMP